MIEKLVIMTNILILYIFVLIGYIAKKTFKEKIDQHSYVVLYIYYLMPIIMLWSILTRPLTWTHINVPLIYLLILIISYGIANISSKWIVNPKERAIARITGLVGNTGNIGIPLGLILWGIESVPYTAMINLINAIFVMTFGAYTYSRGTQTLKESLKNVMKLPMIWATSFAVLLQYSKINISSNIKLFLEMGAYTGLSIQLIILGMYLATIKIKWQHTQLTTITMFWKFIALPLIGLLFCKILDFSNFTIQIILLQLSVPIAVNNINLAALFKCDADKVAWLSLVSFIISILLIPIILSLNLKT